MFLCKKMVVLSGEMSGYVKLERLGDNVTCTISLMTANNDMTLGVKVGAKPVEYFAIHSTRATLRMKPKSDLTSSIACVVLDNGSLIASGSQGKCDILSVASELARELNAYNNSPNTPKIDTNQAISRDLSEKPPKEAASAVKDTSIKDTPVIVTPSAKDSVAISQTAEDYATSGDVIEEEGRKVVDVDNIQEESGYFYEKVKDRLHELFTRYPHDSALEAVVHSSQWVRVDYDDSNYYVVGIIEEDDKPLFICYGVPVDSKLIKAEDRQSNSEWLPLDYNDVDGKGYWVLYQDARSGETLS